MKFIIRNYNFSGYFIIYDDSPGLARWIKKYNFPREEFYAANIFEIEKMFNSSIVKTRPVMISEDREIEYSRCEYYVFEEFLDVFFSDSKEYQWKKHVYNCLQKIDKKNNK